MCVCSDDSQLHTGPLYKDLVQTLYQGKWNTLHSGTYEAGKLQCDRKVVFHIWYLSVRQTGEHDEVTKEVESEEKKKDKGGDWLSGLIYTNQCYRTRVSPMKYLEG